MFPTLPLLRATSRSALNPKRLQTGLYDGRSIQSGNAVGETFNNKTRRTWLPNVQSKAVWSEALGRKLRLKVTVGALRTIDKMGGLDAYLFRTRPERLGEKGMKLREMVQEAHQARKLERRALAATPLEEEATSRL
ncbi:ribosomal L28 family-domain-containing protein [Leucosporidium creatinivorum]|uniref:Large ribosomal subunit protein bL28m n=1 Tax=Leucosporidium creatinivorum TaxID=106004 RepID=A0A1Y2G540_9BASI|nr:ribosomal L28 family-domain-containing protein [Leucosporidium creatinivorum]